FISLGGLPGGTINSTALAVSADGSVVVGCSDSDVGVQAFRWTRHAGMVGLGFQRASAVSGDGSIVVGHRLVANRAEPVRWTQQGGVQSLGIIAGYEYGDACCINADGSVVAGTYDPNGAIANTAFRWTQASGISRLKHLPESVFDVDVFGVSDDGEVI